MKVLICEDNALIALDLAEMVVSSGHRVEGTVDRATDCLEQCSRTRPDLVLSDLNLADGRTGLDLVEALADRGIPAVIVSSEANAVPPTTSAKAVLEKPVHECDLTIALDRLNPGAGPTESLHPDQTEALMNEMHTPESAARAILGMFRSHNAHPGEAVLSGALGQLAVAGVLPCEKVDDGVRYGVAQGWFENGPRGALRLTQAGFAEI